MSAIVAEICDALREAGASEEKARKAAEVVASFDSKHNDVKHGFAALEGEFSAVKWMLATNLALTLFSARKAFLALIAGQCCLFP